MNAAKLPAPILNYNTYMIDRKLIIVQRGKLSVQKLLIINTHYAENRYLTLSTCSILAILSNTI